MIDKKIFECQKCKNRIEATIHAIEAKCMKCDVWIKTIIKEIYGMGKGDRI